SDLSGKEPPKQAYSLFSTDALETKPAATKPRFYVGGNIYSDWASVPNRYKMPPPLNVPDPDSRTASLFRFQWGRHRLRSDARGRVDVCLSTVTLAGRGRHVGPPMA